MNIDAILDHPEYNLRSVSRLAARDDPWTRVWLDRLDPLYGIYMQVRNRRLIIRKEFYETAFVIDRLQDELSRVPALWELGAGHGMLGLFSSVMYPRLSRATLIDQHKPSSYERIREHLAVRFPYVKVRTRFIEGKIQDAVDIPPGALVVGVHACGALTDRVVETAAAAGADFAVVPCCEAKRLLPLEVRRETPPGCVPQAVAEMRLARWRGMGYAVEERALPEAVTGRGRIFIGRAPTPGSPLQKSW